MILEADDKYRDTPAGPGQALHQERRRAADDPAQRRRPSWDTSLGMQSVNHLNQFTSVTFAFNLMPGTATGDATNFIEKAAAETLPRHRPRRPAGRGQDVQGHRRQPDAADGRRGVRDVRDPRHPLRELPAPDHGALVAAGGAGGRAGDAVAVPRAGVAVRLRRHVPADGDREEERHHDRGLRAAARGPGRDGREGDPRRQHGPLPPDHDDDAGRRHGRACRSPWARAPTARAAGRWAW